MEIRRLGILTAVIAATAVSANAQSVDDDAFNKVFNAEETYGYDRAPRYRGFVEENFTFGVGEYNDNRVGLTTTHGCQISPYFFLGAGMGFDYWIDNDVFSMPVFAQMHLEFHKAYRRNASPFLDFKIGYSAVNAKGFYCNPAIGCHFYFGHSNAGISVRLGYIAQLAETTTAHWHSDFTYNGWNYQYNSYTTYTKERHNWGGVQLGVAIDW